MTAPVSGPFVSGPVRFDGAVYDPALDDARLTKQLGRVFEALREGAWHTLPEIAAATGDPPASISAQLRHLRKPRFGGYLVEKRRRTPCGGLWEYRLSRDGDGLSVTNETSDQLSFMREVCKCDGLSVTPPASPVQRAVKVVRDCDFDG